jgi:hypothetical protein
MSSVDISFNLYLIVVVKISMEKLNYDQLFESKELSGKVILTSEQKKLICKQW